ncbi:MAG: monovalent cation/H(+) antiporter subunit G [Verrucomicrobia bacterium]|nr:monovalent cation/H(+) antiporter subunit G [Verrucomicrobiota bacterium]
MNLPDLFSMMLICLGAVFFLAGTVGMLRFPDTFTRLHALTKADNLGLGFVVAGLVFQSGSVLVALKLVGIWLLAMLASSNACYLIGGNILREQEKR